MRARYITLLPLALIFASCLTTVPGAESAVQEDTAAESLPVDPSVTVGQLDNGLSYYIRQNDEPRERAFLRLAVDAGSILEDADQLGLAHFLEHMAFNGTESFSGNELIAFLEQLGIQFGPDVNAYTSFDETVYELTVPTDSPETFARALQVLYEWASAMTLDTEEIDKERGVIVEEWRFRRGAAARMREEQYPVLFGDSKYAERLPIGDVDLIQTFDQSVLRRFYDDWYRPELMAIVAVGDFDPQEIEQQIVDLFGTLDNPADPRPRDVYSVPDHDETRFAVASDPETAYTTVSMYTKRDAEDLTTVDDYRQLIMGRLFSSMVNDRLDEISRQPTAPFLGAGVSSGSLVRSKSAATLSAAVEGNDVAPALESLVQEVRRVREFGFTPDELERAKANRLRAIEQTFRERENINSESYADEYVRAFLENEAIPGIPFERELHEQILPTITLSDLNALADTYLDETNRVIVVSAVDSEDLPIVTEAQLRDALERGRVASIEPYVEEAEGTGILPIEPTPGFVVSRSELDAEGAVELELSNGSRVVYMETDHRADQVLFSAFRDGGTSTVPDDQFRSAQYLTVFTEQMGYGSLTASQIERELAGRALSVSPYLDTYEEGLSGSASIEDLETMLQLVNLKMTSPRADTGVFDALSRQFAAILANQESQPSYQLNRRFSELFNGGHPRALPMTGDELSELDLDAMIETHDRRFGNARGFTFVFVGTIDEAELTPLVERYLASLPSELTYRGWTDVGIRRPTDTVTDTVRAGVEPVSEVVIAYFGDYVFSQESNYAIRALERFISIRMQESIREDESGTYGVGVQASFTRTPHERYAMLITFRADPDRISELTERVFSVLDEIRAETPEPSYVERVRETQRAGFEEGLTSNQFWLGQLNFALKNERPVQAIRNYINLVDALDGESIRAAARQYLDEERYVQVTLLPQE